MIFFKDSPYTLLEKTRGTSGWQHMGHKSLCPFQPLILKGLWNGMIYLGLSKE